MPNKGSALLSCSSFILISGTLAVISLVNAAQATSTLEEGDVRLINDDDNTNMTGRLEFYHNGQWGTVCGEYFDSNAAMVVCRQLGFDPVGAIAVFRAGYGQGIGPIWLDYIYCTGSEENISSCADVNTDTFPTYCYHSEDAGVICQSNTTQAPIQVHLINGGKHSGTV